MIVYENRKELLLNIIKWGNNPFKKFVSTGEIKEDLDLVNSRIDLIQRIKELKKKYDPNNILNKGKVF